MNPPVATAVHQPLPVGMRWLMTADTVGGVWTYAMELCTELAARGASVALATMGRLPSADQRAEAARIPGLTLHESAWRLEWMDEPWEEVARAGEWLLELEREVRPHVVHLNGYVHGALPFRAPVLVAGHSCVLSWWRAVHGEEAPEAWNRYRSLVTEGLRAASEVVAPSAAMLSALRHHYGLKGGRVIPNGRSARAFAPGAKEPLILAAGRVWDEAKNLKLLAQVADRLPWPVVVAGEDRHPSGSKVTFGEGLRFLGRLDTEALAQWYGRASIFVLPARYEPFGLSAVEAALSGCALVLGDIPSLREVWGDAAVFVNPDEPEDLVQAITRLAGDDNLRHRLAVKARERASSYSPSRMRAAYLEICRSLQVKGKTRGEVSCAS